MTVLPDFSLVTLLPLPFDVFLGYFLARRERFRRSRIKTVTGPCRWQAFSHMPVVWTVILVLLPCTFSMYSARLLQTELRFFELHEFGNETDIRGYAFPSFRDIGV